MKGSSSRRWTMVATGIVILGAVWCALPGRNSGVQAADGSTAAPAASAVDTPVVKAQDLLKKGLAYLRTQQDPKTFTWGKGDEAPGITGMAITAFVQSGVDPDTDWLDHAGDAMIAFQKKDGGVYDTLLPAYSTAIVIRALSSAPEAEWKEPREKAVAFLRTLQWTDKIQGLPANEQPPTPDSPKWGGVGYGSGKEGRPDLSNLQMFLDAMHDAGIKPDDPAYKNAVIFLSRTQNLSETNDQKWAGNDGGFVYSPANAGMSAAGEYTDANGKRMLRSYGSMTYAGLKSMIYAGLTRDDPRVKAAWAWIAKNWTLDDNPGMKEGDPKSAQAGLYYYYHTLARALHAYGEPIIVDPQGNKHDWRIELINKLATLQKPDGNWIGDKNPKWMESNPVLVTCYVTLALEETLTDLKDHPVK